MRPSPLFLALVAVFAGSCVAAALSTFGGSYYRAAAIAIVISGWVVSLCLHEFAHAAAAYLGGDRSEVARGYLQLDPRRYTHPLFSIALPILFLLAGGIGLPGGAVWIETDQLRSRRYRTAVALAGPATNVALGALLLAIVGFGVAVGMPVLHVSLAYLGYLQFATAVLCLLPVPGLDGFHAIEPYLPYEVRRAVAPLGTYAVMLLLVLLLTTNLGRAIADAALAGAQALGVDRITIAIGRIAADMSLTGPSQPG